MGLDGTDRKVCRWTCGNKVSLLWTEAMRIGGANYGTCADERTRRRQALCECLADKRTREQSQSALKLVVIAHRLVPQATQCCHILQGDITRSRFDETF